MPGTLRRAPLLLLAALLLSPSAAFADAVSRAHLLCPPGTHLVTNHYGSDCAPDNCPFPSTPGICGPGGHGCCRVDLCEMPNGACEYERACQVERFCAKPGMAAPYDDFRELVGTCDEKGICPAGSACEMLPACFRKRSIFNACSCELAPKQEPIGPPLLAFALGCFLFVLRFANTRKAASGMGNRK